MTNQFRLDLAFYSGHTIPGSSYMRIFSHQTMDYIGTYVPITYEARDGVAKGRWKSIATESDQQTLQKLQPQIIKACEQRYLYFQDLIKRTKQTD